MYDVCYLSSSGTLQQFSSSNNMGCSSSKAARPIITTEQSPVHHPQLSAAEPPADAEVNVPKFTEEELNARLAQQEIDLEQEIERARQRDIERVREREREREVEKARELEREKALLMSTIESKKMEIRTLRSSFKKQQLEDAEDKIETDLTKYKELTGLDLQKPKKPRPSSLHMGLQNIVPNSVRGDNAKEGVYYLSREQLQRLNVSWNTCKNTWRDSWMGDETPELGQLIEKNLEIYYDKSSVERLLMQVNEENLDLDDLARCIAYADIASSLGLLTDKINLELKIENAKLYCVVDLWDTLLKSVNSRSIFFLQSTDSFPEDPPGYPSYPPDYPANSPREYGSYTVGGNAGNFKLATFSAPDLVVSPNFRKEKAANTAPPLVVEKDSKDLDAETPRLPRYSIAGNKIAGGGEGKPCVVELEPTDTVLALALPKVPVVCKVLQGSTWVNSKILLDSFPGFSFTGHAEVLFTPFDVNASGLEVLRKLGVKVRVL